MYKTLKLWHAVEEGLYISNHGEPRLINPATQGVLRNYYNKDITQLNIYLEKRNVVNLDDLETMSFPWTVDFGQKYILLMLFFVKFVNAVRLCTTFPVWQSFTNMDITSCLLNVCNDQTKWAQNTVRKCSNFSLDNIFSIKNNLRKLIWISA